ncbi:MAG TPA: c-type cytochrome, partial [Polyangiaceae bacterium]|nr:c-type cytochrome [Polyangiaceae bacterium]
TDVGLSDAAFVAYDNAGTLFSATHHGLYELEGSAMQSVYDTGGRTIHALVASGANVWFAVDGDLGLVQNGHVSITSGASFPSDVHLAGSPSGDVWVVAAGRLARYSARSLAPLDDQAVWTNTVEPTYAAICSHCHSAEVEKDRSGVDLSTYAMWDAHRAQVYQRVVTQAGTPSAMPPATSGFTLTDAQRAAIEAWSKAK